MFWFFVILVIVIAAIFGIAQSNAKAEELKQQGKKNEETFNSLTGFKATKTFKGVKDTYIFGIDENNKKIAFVKKYYKEIVPFEQIISVEILEDNTILQQKSSLRTIGGAVVGGAIAGGAGAIVGGLSGDTKQNKKVSKVQVKIKLRDINHPSFTIDCFNCKTMTAVGEPIKPSSMEGYLYKQGLNDAQRIADTISAIIDITDKASNNVTNSTPQQAKPVGSIADELSKLADLKEKGILTEEEFNTQKKVLLSGTTPAAPVTKSVEPQQLDITFDDGVPQDVREALDRGEKLTAIKLYMDNTGCGLAEAKDFVESIS